MLCGECYDGPVRPIGFSLCDYGTGRGEKTGTAVASAYGSRPSFLGYQGDLIMARHTRLQRFFRDVLEYTPFLQLLLLLVAPWLLFAAGLYGVEANRPGRDASD
jgi:hypothetical protein